MDEAAVPSRVSSLHVSALRAAGERCTRPTITVRSPYDGSVIGEVPACTAGRRRPRRRDRQGGAARAARCRCGSGPRSSTAPPRLLDRAPRGVRPDHRRGGGQADQDGPGRGRARRRHVPVRRRRGPHARRRDGAARRRSPPGEGKLGFTLRVPIGVVGAIAPFNFPLNLVAHKLAPGDRRRLPGGAQAGAARRRFSAIALAELLIDECGLPAELAERRHRRRRHGRQRDRRPPRHRADHVHRLARGRLGHPRPGAAQEGRPRARQQRAGHHRARRRLEDRGRQDQGRRLQPRRPELHLDAADLRAPLDRRRRSPPRWSTEVEHAGRRRPARRGHRRVGADLARRARPGRRRGSTRPSPAGPRSSTGGDGRRRRRARARRCSPTSRPT